ncbi:PX domain-containing protein ypt35 [Aphanomyces cochlioides]|nr:PX domain-containing protein ypt35 [Aphanomyces cochlioides]
MTLLEHLQEDLDIILTLGAVAIALTIVGFIGWCSYHARRTKARILPRQDSSQLTTQSSSPRSTKSTKPTAIQVRYTRDTLPIAGSYIVFTIELSWEAKKKVVEKRYSDFDQLFATLKKEMKPMKVPIALPPMPRKSLLFKFDEAFLESRRQGLQFFLEFVMRHPILSEFASVRAFCGL